MLHSFSLFYAEVFCAGALQRIMTAAPAVLHALLAHLADALVVYVCHQINSGAQASLNFLYAGISCED